MVVLGKSREDRVVSALYAAARINSIVVSMFIVKCNTTDHGLYLPNSLISWYMPSAGLIFYISS